MKTLSKKLTVALALSLPIAASSAVAFAFPFGNSWMQPSDGINNPGPDGVAGRAGGGGIWGTGSKMDKGLKCSNCHIDPDGMIDATVEFTPPLTNGAYSPGQPYTIKVTLLNEVHVQDATHPNTLNGFGLTFENAGGTRAGVLRSDIAGVDSNSCPANYPATNPTNGTSYVYGNCNAIIYVPKNNTTVWNMGWTAPAAGSGEVSMYYSVVDGDHTDKSSLDDDVKEGVLTIPEGT
jgi:hypothetical protein